MLKTYLIDIDALQNESFKELVGFVLTIGLAFRKIDLISGENTGQCLVIELATKGEETALRRFLNDVGAASPIVIKNDNKATLDGKKLGYFSQVRDVTSFASYYVDKTSGKKFALIQGE